MKRIIAILLTLAGLSISAYSQPNLIQVSGTLLRANGQPCASCSITISRAVNGTSTTGTSPVTVTANGSGVISFTAVQNSFAIISGSFTHFRYVFTSGVNLYFPGCNPVSPCTIDFDSLKSAEDSLFALISPATYAPGDAKFIVQTVDADLTGAQSLGALTTGLLKNTVTGATGVLSRAVPNTDYQPPLAFAARLTNVSDTIDLAASGVTSGTCTACDLTIDTYGRVTAKASGVAGGGVWGSITGTLSNQTDLQTALNLKAALASPALSGNPTAPTQLTADDSTRIATTAFVHAVAVGMVTGVSSFNLRTGAVVPAQDDYTFAQLASKPTTLAGYGITDAQPIDADLTTISGLTPTNDDVMQYKAGAWANRTIAQLQTDLSLSGTNTGDQTSVTGNAGTATALQNARTINGTSFDGTANITVTVPVATGITGLGTGVATALAVNVGSAGAFVTFGGALGTPSSGTLTNATGLPPTTGISGWPANASGQLTNDGAGVLSWAAGGGSGANAALSNLASVSINASLIPQTTIDLGAAATAWRNLYIYGGGTFGSHSIKLHGTPTGNRTVTFLDADYTVARQDAAQTFTGIQTFAGTVALRAGTATAGTAPIKFQTGTLLTAPEAGAVEYDGSRFYFNNNGANRTVALGSGATAAEGAFYFGNITPSSTNYTFLGDGAGVTALNTTASGVISLRFNNVAKVTIGAGVVGTSISVLAVGDAHFGSGVASGASIFLGSGGFSYGSGDYIRHSAVGTIELFGGGTGAAAIQLAVVSGNVGIGTKTFGTSAKGTLAIFNSTAPTSSPADEFQLYSADSAAGAANAFIRNELGEITRISGLSARNSAAFVVTSSTTLVNITGLSRNVEAGRTYAFRAVLQTTAAATGGVKFAVSGTATATSISYEGTLLGGLAIVAQTRATALDTVVGASTTTTGGTCTIEGVIVVNAAGTLTIQFAQNNSDVGASTVLVNQYMQLIPIS